MSLMHLLNRWFLHIFLLPLPIASGFLAPASVFPQHPPAQRSQSSIPLTHKQQAQQLFTRALQLARTLPPDEFGREQVSLKAATLGTIAIQLAQAGDPQQAKTVFQEAEMGIRKNLRDWEQTEALADLAVQLTEAGFTDAALKLVTTLSQQEWLDDRYYRQAEALNQIAVQLIAQGKLEQAQQLVPQILTLARKISDTAGYQSNGSCGIWRYEVLTGLAETLAMLHQTQKAIATVKETLSCSAASEGGTNYQFQGIIAVLKHVKTQQDLLQMLNAIPTLKPEGNSDQIFHETAVKAARLDQPTLARRATHRIQDKVLKAYTEFTVESYNLREGDRQKSLNLIRRTEEFYKTNANELNNVTWLDTLMLPHLAANVVRIKQPDLLERLQQRDATGFNDRIAIEFAKLGETQAALDLLKMIADVSVWQTVMPYLQTPKALAQAEQIVQSPEFPAPDYISTRDPIMLSITKQQLRLHQVNAAQAVTRKIIAPEIQAQALAIVATYLMT
ncbi:MAG: hypothetical protein VKJ24_18090, partial [Synechococcales bacterium]|nr:hypothetical protein [Synechococcales bacterium]